jgi:Mor family transcriptional regulator
MQDMLQKGRGRQQHGEKSGRHKLTDAVVRDILADHASGIGYRKLGKKYGVDRKTISCVVRNKTWKHVTR